MAAPGSRDRGLVDVTRALHVNQWTCKGSGTDIMTMHTSVSVLKDEIERSTVMVRVLLPGYFGNRAHYGPLDTDWVVTAHVVLLVLG
ncbi:hypothetical protein PHISCL_09024 [Aspergillus sclerotialis]|uniref:Uncharacterized protein n=1 Tax=Aspergillus sclerotialis TaxID=2070753 RepID=A0A3A2Z8U3_9EURO|nr:hypothetical protein PHISCL_09024 [Aspergillus sclerotialis]